MEPGQVFNPFRVLTGVHIPEAVVSHPHLSFGAKVVYGRLLRYAGERGFCYPSVRTLAWEIGRVSERQAQRYLRELEEHKFIRVLPWYVPNDGDDNRKRQTANRYVFMWHETFESNPLLGVPVPAVA